MGPRIMKAFPDRGKFSSTIINPAIDVEGDARLLHLDNKSVPSISAAQPLDLDVKMDGAAVRGN